MSRRQSAQRCAELARLDEKYTCPEGYECLCRPCHEGTEHELHFASHDDWHVEASSQATVCEKMESCGSEVSL